MDVLKLQASDRSKARAFLDFRLAGRSFGGMETEENMTHNHHRLSFAVLASTCALLAMTASDARAIDVGVSVNAGNAVSADVGASLGGGSGISVNADATADVGGNGVDADANARFGGGRGVNADLNARTGGSNGIDAKATASVASGAGVNANLAIGGVDEAGGKATATPASTFSASQTRTLEAFRSMPVNDQRKMLVRCADISASGGDSGLAGLCSLLQATASR
ncbi:hypothetical protein GR247_37735 [Rhizobium leguminosarum]|nr:hypothetical protein [Rhizobium leguminosarum]NKK61877.1 hypothetical protein [Rhizobium leguminosarum bv. viciae]